MSGKELGVKAVITSVPKKNVYSIISAIQALNIEIIDVTFSINW
jgi:cell division ATPase FtsA